MNKLFTLITVIVAANATAGVADLHWMTGAWAGPAGPGRVLEERWSPPAAGTIAALVRMRTGESTNMVELIVVEEQGDDLVLHIQQWDPGFKPRPPGAQTLHMTSMGEQTVTFENPDGSGLVALTYTRLNNDTFTIEGRTAEGSSFRLELKAL